MTIHHIYAAISPVFRRCRMGRFRQSFPPGEDKTLLDIGGTAEFWRGHEASAAVTLLNPDHTAQTAPQAAKVEFVIGDGCALPFEDNSFDIVFSNSAIEHVGTWARQQAFAAEARRVGRRLWIQTPAREFFIEPHLIAPFVHWLPRPLQRRLIRNFTIRGWIERPGNREVEAFLDEVRLLTLAEMQTLFPDCAILRERFLGMTKSYVAVRNCP